MKKRTIRGAALMSAAAITLSMLTGCGGEKAPAAPEASTPAPNSAASDTSTILFEKPVTFSAMIPSLPMWPYQEDWYINDLIKEKTNVTFDMTAVDSEGFSEKLNLTMASGDLPDMIYIVGHAAAEKYGPQGAFVNILDHLDEMPNFKAWYEQNKDVVATYMTADGCLYQLPCSPESGDTNRRGWLYRKDIFDQLGLEVPTNKEEFYNVLVALKQAYPDSYPLAMRRFGSHLLQLGAIAQGWNTDFLNTGRNCYFMHNEETGEWKFGPTSPEFKEMLEFYHKLYAEGLLIPNFLTIDVKGWQDVMANSDSFVTLDFLSRIDFFNTPMRESNPDFTMAYMAPPVFNEELGQKFGFSATSNNGFVVSSTTKQLDDVLKYIDWLYTDEAEDLLTWGRPGELYTEDANGNRTWKEFTTAADMKKSTGLSCAGYFQRISFDGERATFTPECKEASLESIQYDMPAPPRLSYTDEEQKIVDKVGVNIETYLCEQISKFLLGERSFDTWDDYVAEVEKLGLADLEKVHKSSYDRMMAAMG